MLLTPSRGAIALAAAALAVSVAFGGAPWAILCAVFIGLLFRYEFTPESIVAGTLMSFFWLAAFRWAEDRRFFYPYSMQFAVEAGLLLTGHVRRPMLLGGGSIAALFAAIRILQGATPFVLLVEIAVAGVILSLASLRSTRIAADPTARATAAALGSLLALAGLAVN